VRFYQNNIYEVLLFAIYCTRKPTPIEKQYYALEDDDFYESVFQGSLSDCEAYIRLHENGYM
jgi:hypothetical protein